jgi:predicted glycogen debranching enzyme
MHKTILTLNQAQLRDPTISLSREWLVTNGIGGYASASLAGANTRRYHGLLVAALDAPLGRSVLLSKLEETLFIGAETDNARAFELSANVYPGALHPQGFQWLTCWTAYPAPRWQWSPEPGVRFEKTVFMPQGQNTVCVAYTLQELPKGQTARLTLNPLLAWKDYHSQMRAGNAPSEIIWQSNGAALLLRLPGVPGVTSGPFPLRLSLCAEGGTPFPDAQFEPRPDWYYRFQHPREQERGLDSEEDLFTPGLLAVNLRAGETVYVIATVEMESGTAPRQLWQAHAQRQNLLVKQIGLEDDFAQQLALAADAFVIQVPGRRTTLMAGYPWFSDWGRDTMIALPGLCCTTHRHEIAREILLSFAMHASQGMLPNRFPDRGEHPEYNTVDATLWYFNAIYHYVRESGDLALVSDRLWGLLEEIIAWHRRGTRYRIRLDTADYLLYAGEPGVQLTWMDAKVGDWVMTPRIGKPVEINALWHNALRIMAHFAEQLDRSHSAAYYRELAEQVAASFLARFPRQDGQGLYDVLDTPPTSAPDASIRPNQVFAVSLPFAPIPATHPVAKSMMEVVQTDLYTKVGLRTLSPRDPAYRPRYEGDPWHRDGAYHQGTVWPWLLGSFVEAYHKVYGARMEALALLRPLQAALTAYGMGSLAEVYDAEEPRRPNGCIAQAWSVAETLRVWKNLLTSEAGTALGPFQATRL